MTSAPTPPAGSCSGAATTRRSTSTSSWPVVSPARTRSTTCSTRTPASPASCARRGRRARAPDGRAEAADSGTPLEPAERELIKRLLEFPDEVRESAARRAPHRICAYSMAVAADFHAFYRDCQVVGAEGEGVEALAARPLPVREAHDRRVPGAARDLRARADVSSASRSRPAVLAEIGAPASSNGRAWGLRRRRPRGARSGARESSGDAAAVLVTGARRRRRAWPSASPGSPPRPGAATALVECDVDRPGLAAELGLAAPPRAAGVPAPGGDAARRRPAAGPRRRRGASGAGAARLRGGGTPSDRGAGAARLGSFRHMTAKLRDAYELVVLLGGPLEGAGGALGKRRRHGRQRPRRADRGPLQRAARATHEALAWLQARPLGAVVVTPTD